MHSLDHNRTY